METAIVAGMSGLALWLYAVVLLALCAPKLTGGSIQGATAISVKGTAAPPGTATTSTIQAQTASITGAAQEALSYGTGSGQVNIILAQDRTLAASASDTLDLNTGLSDIFNAAAGTMLHLKYIAVYIVSGGDVNGLLLKTGASMGFLGYGINSVGTIIYPNGPGYQAGEPTVGIAVSSSLANILINNESSAVAVTYRIVVGGTTT